METTNKTARPHFTQPYIEIMDCTLRDGEQTSGVSFLPHEKLMIARKLLGAVLADDHRFAVYLRFGYNMPDGDGIALKVNRIPFQTESFTSPQPVKSGHLNQQVCVQISPTHQ